MNWSISSFQDTTHSNHNIRLITGTLSQKCGVSLFTDPFLIEVLFVFCLHVLAGMYELRGLSIGTVLESRIHPFEHWPKRVPLLYHHTLFTYTFLFGSTASYFPLWFNRLLLPTPHHLPHCCLICIRSLLIVHLISIDVLTSACASKNWSWCSSLPIDTSIRRIWLLFGVASMCSSHLTAGCLVPASCSCKIFLSYHINNFFPTIFYSCFHHWL